MEPGHGLMGHAPLVRRRLRHMLAGWALLLGGCIPLPGGHALTRKTVVAKEGDATLVADDGARCTVPPRTFTAVQSGDEHACVWKEPEGGTRTPPAPSVPRSSARPLGQ